MTTAFDIFSSLCSLSALSEEHRVALNLIPCSEAEAIVRHLYPEFKNNPLAAVSLGRFATYIRTGALDAGAWSGQVLMVYHWLAQNERRADFDDIIEYISCALEASSLQLGHDIRWYLEHYGFEKTRK